MDTAQIPTEVRLLNGGKPLLVGYSNSSYNGLDAVRDMLNNSELSGQTPLCKHIVEVTDQIHNHQDRAHRLQQEGALLNKGAMYLVVIYTDSEATDGDLCTVLQSMEGLPLKIIVRICTTNESTASEYWHNIRSRYSNY